MPLFFWFGHSLGARAEICQIFSLVFWSKRWHPKDILKLTDLRLDWKNVGISKFCIKKMIRAEFLQFLIFQRQQKNNQKKRDETNWKESVYRNSCKKEPGEYLISIDLGSALGYFWSVLELVWSVLGYFWSILGFGASRNDPNDVEDCTISFH